MTPPYRYLIPDPLTPQALLKAAVRLAEANVEGHDLTQAHIEGRFIVVPQREARHRTPSRRATKRQSAQEFALTIDMLEERLLAFLREHGPATGDRIETALGMTITQRGHLLGSLVRLGRLERVGDRYRIPTAPAKGETV